MNKEVNMGKITEVEYFDVPDEVIDPDKICLNNALVTLLDVHDSFITKASDNLETMFKIKNEFLHGKKLTPGKQYREYYSGLHHRHMIVIG